MLVDNGLSRNEDKTVKICFMINDTVETCPVKTVGFCLQKCYKVIFTRCTHDTISDRHYIEMNINSAFHKKSINLCLKVALLK